MQVFLAANRDALIPQVSNRLLFTQSRNPWVRLMGQFTSWAMAKSAQTNKLLTRIENGDVKQMVKLISISTCIWWYSNVKRNI